MVYKRLPISVVLSYNIEFLKRIPAKAKVTIFTGGIFRKNYPSPRNIRMFSIHNGLRAQDEITGIMSKKLTGEAKPVNGINDENLSRSQDEYTRCIQDLNSLQSNTQTIALAKYKSPKDILPLFMTQLELSGIKVDDLNRLNIIHVSGTKGKGSTCAFVESILRNNGKKTGFYNSPHLIKVTERIRINGKPIDDSQFSKYFRQVYEILLKRTSQSDITMPSYFSFLTILSFHIFLEEKVDCAIVEVGIGGEYDPTNIVQRPIACGMTTLDYDHTNILGNSIENIAWSKAGILKRGVPLFVVDDQPEAALQVVKARCVEKHCPLFICRPLEGFSDMQLGIKGSVQLMNASLACQLSKYLLDNVFDRKFDKSSPNLAVEPSHVHTSMLQLPASFKEALTSCSWPGRCQILRYNKVSFFLDGAHTKKSMKNCLEWFLTASKDDDAGARKILMMNIIGERNKYEILSQLCEYDGFESVIFSSNRINSAGDTPKSETFVNIQGPSNEKSMQNVRINAKTWDSLCKEHKSCETNTLIMSNTRDSIEFIHQKAKFSTDTRYHVLVTGSLHFVGAVSETLFIMDELLK